MAARLSFEVWYATGDVQKGTSLADWIAMPVDGVLVVTEFFDRFYGHPRKHCGKRYADQDYFWMDEQGTISEGNADEIPPDVHIKRGQEVDAETWERLYNAACVDPEEGTL
jgi:hypothetical protein